MNEGVKDLSLGNLPERISVLDIRRVFNESGPVFDVSTQEVISRSSSKNMTAYVGFKTAQDANKEIQTLNERIIVDRKNHVQLSKVWQTTFKKLEILFNGLEVNLPNFYDTCEQKLILQGCPSRFCGGSEKYGSTKGIFLGGALVMKMSALNIQDTVKQEESPMVILLSKVRHAEVWKMHSC